MEQTVFSKFNVHDLIGYLMVGAVGVLVFVLDAKYLSLINIPSFTVDLVFIWLIAAYFVGHLIQAVSNVINNLPFLGNLIQETRNNFNEGEKEILQQAGKYFEVEGADNNRLWNLCYMFASAKDITGQVQLFNAHYSLYRGWFVIFFLESLFLFLVLILSHSIETLILLVLSVLITVLFYSRSRRFWQYVRSKVLETFIIVKTLKI